MKFVYLLESISNPDKHYVGISRDPMTPYDVYVDGKAIRIPKWQGWAEGAKAKLDTMLTEEAA